MRATTSVLPPGAHGTRMRTDFSGHAVAAKAGAATQAIDTASAAMPGLTRFIGLLDVNVTAVGVRRSPAIM
jgi:hypothetical protein